MLSALAPADDAIIAAMANCAFILQHSRISRIHGDKVVA
jgi:hypothetical protein